MGFLEEFKIALQHTMDRGAYQDARVLLQGLHRTGTPYDAELFYLEAALCYYEAHYPTAAFFARFGIETYPDFLPLRELLGYLAEQDHAYDEYQPKPTFDCSFLNRTLRIVIYEGVLPMMDYTAEQFRRTFELLGHEVFIFNDKNFTDSAAGLLAFAKKGIDFVLLFNNVGAALTDDRNQNFWDRMNVTCINYLFDHPLYYYQQMEAMPKNAVVTCVDRNHVTYIRRHHEKIKRAFFFPLGAEYLPQEAPIPWEERPIDVLYVGSLKNTQDMPGSALGRLIGEYLLEHTPLTYEAAVEHCLNASLFILKKQGVDITDIKDVHELEPLAGAYGEQIRELLAESARTGMAAEQLHPDGNQERPQYGTEKMECLQYGSGKKEENKERLLCSLLQEYRYIDMNVNAYFRKAMIVTLVNAGIDVHVYGNGWDIPELENQPHFHFGGLLSQTECICKMQESRIVLNSMPWFKDGAHDRIFNAMLCHAVCVTDQSGYLTERFTDGKELVFYPLDGIDSLPRIVRGLLDDPKKAGEIAENGYQSAVLSHSWENRAMELLTRFMTDGWE